MMQRRALDGIRVVDFSWVRAGPWATRWLGALGAEIIKIEWPESERGRLPSSTTPQDLEVNLNTSGNFNDTNVNKKSFTLNVRTPKGLALAKRLIAISDIVMENFSSRVLQNWGLGWVTHFGCPPITRHPHWPRRDLGPTTAATIWTAAALNVLYDLSGWKQLVVVVAGALFLLLADGSIEKWCQKALGLEEKVDPPGSR
jgi:hypothetical protein